MAKRYIDADTLTERLRLQYCKECDNYNGVRCGSCDIDFVFDMVEDAPTADVVEVCRCSECKHLEIINKAPIYAKCEKHGIVFELWQEDTRERYCSWGERRKDDDVQGLCAR